MSFSYDLLGRRLAATTSTAADNVAYGYDNAGRLTSTTANGKTLSYQVDAAGNRTRTTWPEDTPFYVTTSYDALNRPSVISELGTSTLASYAYDDLSRRTVITRGNASTTTTYGYTTQGALGTLTHNLTGTAQDESYTYTRNQVQEIGSTTWTNDANGNRKTSGVWTYGYDLNNRLRTANKPSPAVAATLNYDAEGRLRQTVINAATTNLTYDGQDLVAEYDAAGALLRRYVHGPGVDEPLVVFEGATTANKSWLYADHLGSIIGTADVAGNSTGIYSYGPYGELSSGAGPRFKFTGQQYIAGINLFYYKARFYSTYEGRFLQTDPIGTADDLNLYAYVGNNPVNFRDPSGLSARDALMLGWKLSDAAKALDGESFQIAGLRTPDKDNMLLEGGGGGGGVPGINIGGGAGRGSVNPSSGGGFFRGAKPGESPSFTPRTNEYKVDAGTGFVKETHGVSVFDNAGSVSSKGYVPHRIEPGSVPDSLRVIQRGADPRHFEIVPNSGANLTPQQYMNACSSIVCVK